MTWGSGPWGTGPFGGIPATFEVSYAYAVSTNEVVVVLNKAPLDRSAFLTGDVRNPMSWSITIPATDYAFSIAGVAAYAQPFSWLVRTLEKLPPTTETCLVTAVGLKDAGGGVISSADNASFAGVTERAISTPTALAATRNTASRDLANVPAPGIVETTVGGTFVIKGGDYALQEGPELARKLIYRRLISTPGDFFHLSKYGVGLKVKQLIPAGDMVKLKANIERQIKLEPDLAVVQASIAMTLNKLTVVVKAQMSRTGQNVTVSLNSPIGQG